MDWPPLAGRVQVTMIHVLKCHPKPFAELRLLRKTFEWRRNDRNYQVGDLLYLQEWDPETGEFTGSLLRLYVNSIMTEGFGLPEGFCIMSVNPFLFSKPGIETGLNHEQT